MGGEPMVLAGFRNCGFPVIDRSPFAMVAIADALRPVEQAAAQERYEQTRPGVGGKFPPTEKGKARDKVAEFTGVSDNATRLDSLRATVLVSWYANSS